MASVSMAESRNRRLVSGQRVVCACSLELPKSDPFLVYKASRKGVFVLNVRGGSLYLADQFTERSIAKVFPSDQSSVIKNIKLYPKDAPIVELGDISVRYLKLTQDSKMVGVVVRFTNLTDGQIDILNDLPKHFPIAGSDEVASVPIDDVYRPKY